MAGVFRARARLLVECSHAHALHQHAHVFTSHVEPLPIQLVAQDRNTHELVLKV
jgi:hypothetical protein